MDFHGEVLALICIFIILYYMGVWDSALFQVEKLYSWLHFATTTTFSPISENYSVCSPTDCTRYRVRKDQLLVKNPFKWPWVGTDFPQYAVQYNEVNKTASQIYKPRTMYKSERILKCH